MRIHTLGFLLSLTSICIASAGCGNRTTTVVGSTSSPDGRHVFWVTNEYGGLGSGVVSVHLTTPVEKPTLANAFLRTPECTATVVRWSGSNAIEISYDAIDVTVFAPDRGPAVVQLKRRTVNDSNDEPAKGDISLPCDPY